MPIHETAVLLLLALHATGGNALQVPGEPPPRPPVRWSVEPAASTVHAAAVFTLQVAARIEPGWHLYALEEPEGGPAATQIGIVRTETATLLRVAEPPPHRLRDSNFPVTATAFEGDPAFILRLRAGRSPGTSSLKVLVRYQACNERMCLPARQEVLSTTIAIAP